MKALGRNASLKFRPPSKWGSGSLGRSHPPIRLRGGKPLVASALKLVVEGQARSNPSLYAGGIGHRGMGDLRAATLFVQQANNIFGQLFQTGLADSHVHLTDPDDHVIPQGQVRSDPGDY